MGDRFLKNDSVVCADIGDNALWMAGSLPAKRGQIFLTSEHLGIMGYALNAGIVSTVSPGGKDRRTTSLPATAGSSRASTSYRHCAITAVRSSDKPLALGCMYSIGAIAMESNGQVQASVTEQLAPFGVTGDRIYINFFVSLFDVISCFNRNICRFVSYNATKIHICISYSFSCFCHIFYIHRTKFRMFPGRTLAGMAQPSLVNWNYTGISSLARYSSIDFCVHVVPTSEIVGAVL